MILHRLLALDVAPYPDPIELGEDVVEAFPLWIWIASGSCCALAGLLCVVALLALILVLRRRKKD